MSLTLITNRDLVPNERPSYMALVIDDERRMIISDDCAAYASGDIVHFEVRPVDGAPGETEGGAGVNLDSEWAFDLASPELEFDEENFVVALRFPTSRGIKLRPRRYDRNPFHPEGGQRWAIRESAGAAWEVVQIVQLFDEYEGAEQRRRVLVDGQRVARPLALDRALFEDPNLAALLPT